MGYPRINLRAASKTDLLVNDPQAQEPRCHLIDPSSACAFPVVSRHVRQAWLCEEDRSLAGPLSTAGG